MVVDRRQLREEIARLLALLTNQPRTWLPPDEAAKARRSRAADGPPGRW